MKTNKKSVGVSPFLLVILSFLLVIFLGAFLLVTPLSRSNGQWGNFVDALFTAVSATCVTGLSVYRNGIAGDLTVFGQIVVLICIQIGGLGFMTILAFIITLFRHKLQFKDRYLLSQAVGSASMSDLVIFVRKIILISFSFEIIGTALLLPVFLQVTDVQHSLWFSVFHSVSAYNNAGFDVFGTVSLVLGNSGIISSLPQWAYIYLCIATMLLIVLGGISFLTVIDVFHFRKPSQWRAFTKIVLLTTFILIFGGAALFMLTEGTKATNRMDVLQAFFQSITLRTAGFATYDQANLSVAGKVISCILMFIGGSPLSTAGGVKTTTFFMIILAMTAYFRGRKIVAFKRYYSNGMVIKAMSLVFTAIFIILGAYLIVSGFESNNPMLDDERQSLIYEVFSAFGTVGVSTGITPYLSVGSKITLCVLMFIGRLGPISFMQIFQRNLDVKEKYHFQYVEEDFLIG